MPTGWELLDQLRSETPNSDHPQDGWGVLDVVRDTENKRRQVFDLWQQQHQDFAKLPQQSGGSVFDRPSLRDITVHKSPGSDTSEAMQRLNARSAEIDRLNAELPAGLRITEPPPFVLGQEELGAVEGVKRGIYRGVLGMAQGLMGLREGALDSAANTPGEGEPPPGTHPDDVRVARGMQVAGDKMRAAAAISADQSRLASGELSDLIRRAAPSKSVAEGGPFQPGNPKWWSERGSETVPQLGTQIGAAYLTGGGSVLAELGTFAATGGAIEAGSTYSEARQRLIDAGMDESQASELARKEALIVGGINSAIETIPGKALAPSAKPTVTGIVKPVLNRLLKGGAAEGAEEVAQQAVSDAARSVLENDPAAFENWPERYAAAGALGGLAGAGMGSVEGAVDVASGKTQAQTVDLLKYINEVRERLKQPGNTTATTQSGSPQPAAAPSPGTPPTTGSNQPTPPAAAPTTQPADANALGQAFYGSPDTAAAWAAANPEAANKLIERNRHSQAAFNEVDKNLPKFNGVSGAAATRKKWFEAVKAAVQKSQEAPQPTTVPVPDNQPGKEVIPNGEKETQGRSEGVLNPVQPVPVAETSATTPPTGTGGTIAETTAAPTVADTAPRPPIPAVENVGTPEPKPVGTKGKLIPVRNDDGSISWTTQPVNATPSQPAHEVPSAESSPVSPDPGPNVQAANNESQSAPQQSVGQIDRKRVVDLYREFNPDIHPAAVEKNADALIEVLNSWKYSAIVEPFNKTSRKVFESITGIKLPSTIKDTKAVFDSTKPNFPQPSPLPTRSSVLPSQPQVVDANNNASPTAQVPPSPGNVAIQPQPTMDSPAPSTQPGNSPGGSNAVQPTVSSATPVAGTTEPPIPTAAAPSANTAQAVDKTQAPDLRLATAVETRLKANETIDHDTFFADADREYGSTRSQGGYGPSDAYDALETGINRHIASLPEERYTPVRQADLAGAINTARNLNELVSRVPPQRNRSGEKDAFQQFSTPPAYAYVANWVANPGPGDVVLEPSAGTGSLAVHAAKSGASVVGNEWSTRRAELLRTMPLSKVLVGDAEQIHNTLPTKFDQRPNVVVMNPPFSRAANRMGDKKIQGTDTVHIDAALKSLVDGGRLVAIMGAGLHGPTKQFTDWLAALPYDVKASVDMGRDVYKGYGTTFPTRLLVIDKVPRGRSTVTGTANTLEDAIKMLEVVRDVKPESKPQPFANQSASTGASKPAGGGTGSQQTVLPAAGSVGGEQQAGVGSAANERPPGRTAGSPVADGGLSTGSGNEAPASPGRAGDDSRPSGSGTGSAAEVLRPAPTAGTGSREPSGEPVLPAAAETPENVGVRAPVNDNVPESAPKDKTKPGTKKTLTDDVYDQYVPRHVNTPADPKDHPAELVETAAMAAVPAPKLSYVPAFAADFIKRIKLSSAQMEAVAAAGQAFETMIQIGEAIVRKGFLIGDGTGVGKGMTIAAIIKDNWNRGRKKAVWITENVGLFSSAVRDAADMEIPLESFFSQPEVPNPNAGADNSSKKGKRKNATQTVPSVQSGAPISGRDEGILFTTYSTLGMAANAKSIGQGRDKSRLQQIVEWLGKDFDGVIVFDEAHNMRSGIARQGSRGVVDASKRASAGIELQALLPKARILYVSATSATEAHNLAFATRLGLWGRGTAFPSVTEFVNTIANVGMSMMEMVAADMKAMGSFVARAISFKGVYYEPLVHELSEFDTQTWDKMSDAWRSVIDGFHDSMNDTDADASAKGRAESAIRGANLRFWASMLTSMSMPTVLADMRKALDRGESCIVQLTSTGDAALKRALADAIADEDGTVNLDDVDVSPKRILMELVEQSFPIYQYQDEEFQDAEGNVRKRKVMAKDPETGKPIINQDALDRKNQILDELGALRGLADRGAIDTLIDEFGVDVVAEVTGRSKRLIREKDGKLVQQTRETKNANAAEVAAFQDGKKRILVFSKAGNTGGSYHADRRAKNQQKRRHYLLEAGWRADDAIQGFGRSHRSNEVSAPTYILVTTDLKGHRRFISTIARRLGQLGAFSKGQREAGESGMFKSTDNLESKEANASLYILYRQIAAGQVPGFDLDSFQRYTDLQLIDPETGGLKKNEDLPPMPKFLNRLLNLRVKAQNDLFEHLNGIIERVTEKAKQDGTFDQGLRTIRANHVEKTKEQTVFTHPDSGATTKHMQFQLRYKTQPRQWSDLHSNQTVTGYVRSLKTNKVYPVVETGTDEQDRTSGIVSAKVRLYKPSGFDYSTRHKIENSDHWASANEAEARESWQEQIADMGEWTTQDAHLLVGTMLPIWDRLPEYGRMARIQTDDGDVFIGREVDPSEISQVLTQLGAGAGSRSYTAKEIVSGLRSKSFEFTLSNKWKLAAKSVDGELRIEIIGPTYSHMGELRGLGVFTERVGYNTRFFVPNDSSAESVIEAITTGSGRQVVEATSLRRSGGTSYGSFGGGQIVPNAPQPKSGKLNIPSELLPEQKLTRERFMRAFGQDRPLIKDKIKEWLGRIGRKFRSQEYLPEKDVFLAPARDIMRLLPRERGRAIDHAGRLISSIVEGLAPDEYMLFNNVLLWKDLKRGIENGELNSFGIGVDDKGEYDADRALDEIESDLARFETIVKQNPSVESALARREAAVATLVNDLVELDMLPAEIRDNPQAYFHHQVRAYQQTERFAKISGKFKKTRSFQRKRATAEAARSEEMDFNSNYVEAEMSWMADAVAGMAVERAYRELDRQYNIRPQLAEKAKRANFIQMVGGIANANRIEELKGLIAESRAMGGSDSQERLQRKQWIEELQQLDPTYPYRVRIAMFMDKLADENPELGYIQSDPDEPSSSYWRAVRKIANDQNDPSVALANALLREINDQQAMIEQALGDSYRTWETLATEQDGYTIWSPTPDNSFFKAWTIPDSIVAQFEKGLIDELKLDRNQIHQVLAMGGIRNQIVIPTDLANQLDLLTSPKTTADVITETVDMLNAAWKRTILLAPWRIVGYETRNFLGDMDPVLSVMGIPEIMTYAKSAYDELGLFYRGDGTPVSDRTRSAHNLEVLDSGFTATNMEDLRDLPQFEYLFDELRPGDKKPLTPLGVGKAYVDKATQISKIREGIMRLAVFNWLIDSHIKNKKFPTYGASYPEAVDAIEQSMGRERAAAKISRELLGDYGDISQIGMWLARLPIPFWKFQEINLRRYPRLIANAWRQGGKAKAAGMAGRWAAREAIVNTGRLGLLWAIAKLISWLNDPEDEDKLPEHIQNSPHITLGRRPDGSVLVLNNVGSLGDFLEWFGLNDLWSNVDRLQEGQVGLGYVAKEAAKSSVNKVAGSITPVVKTPFELMTGKSLFPNVFNPVPIERDVHLAQQLGLGDEYKLAKGYLLGDGTSVRPNWYSRWLGVTIAQPNKSALDAMHAARNRYLESQGEPVENVGQLSKWRNVKQALVNQDYESFRKARAVVLQSAENGGAAYADFLAFVQKLDPVEYRMSDKKEQAFLEWLNEEERTDTLPRARQYATDLGDLGIVWWETSSRQDDLGPQRQSYREELADRRLKAAETMSGKGYPRRGRLETSADYRVRQSQFLDRQKAARGFLRKAGTVDPDK